VFVFSKNDVEHTHPCEQFWLYLDIFIFSLIKSLSCYITLKHKKFGLQWDSNPQSLGFEATGAIGCAKKTSKKSLIRLSALKNLHLNMQ